MAKTGAVWGIDIGQCALKALRCRPHEKESNRIVVEAFDYVEYPKILSQPDADREELVREALETFLSRNEVKGDRVAISVPGQSGLARFIKLPPVEAKKIPDIVKYEARQQIPFALEDVVWDYQPLEGGSQDDGFALETEIGLFAMKRDQVASAIEPLEQAGVEVDLIQLAPLAVYNYACFDRLNNMEDAEPYDPEDPPESKVVLSFGADTTDLVITNGYRVWQRNIPIGGSHFTKALTKELKLTFAKAEHLKRNAKKAEDPKALFQAMRPIFSDLVAEIQRSLGFFMSNNRGAKLGEIIALGNPMKLPGLQRFLSQNLEQDVKPVDAFPALVGGSVTDSPQFEDNKLAFATCYGLCVQALELSQLSTNLLPDELVTSRLIRAKKPWMVAAVALLMAGAAVSYASYYNAWQNVDVEDRWGSEISQSKQLKTRSSGFIGDNGTLREQFTSLVTIGDNLQSNADGRLLWAELIKAIGSAVPRDSRPKAERPKTAEDVTSRSEIHIQSVDVQFFAEDSGGLSSWFQGKVASLYEEARKTEEYVQAARAEEAQADAAAADGEGGALTPPADAVAEPATEAPAEEVAIAEEAYDDGGYADQGYGAEGLEGASAIAGPTGAGWVIELTGHHFHNNNDKLEPPVAVDAEGGEFVRRTLIKNLLEGSIQLPDGAQGELKDVTLTKLGISYPVIVTENKIENAVYDPEATLGDDSAGRRRMGGEEATPFDRDTRRPGARAETDEPLDPMEGLWQLRRYDFKLQFIWQPTPRHERNKPEGEAIEVEFDPTAMNLRDRTDVTRG